eukprot:GHVU01071115.1.p1 GENE.GHVU01071115.1~~GHVU01071115.1.p1  ORF type:complete len:169 (+),score=23.27 GHVU01071115.1:464-970(+)
MMDSGMYEYWVSAYMCMCESICACWGKEDPTPATTRIPIGMWQLLLPPPPRPPQLMDRLMALLFSSSRVCVCVHESLCMCVCVCVCAAQHDVYVRVFFGELRGSAAVLRSGGPPKMGGAGRSVAPPSPPHSSVLPWLAAACQPASSNACLCLCCCSIAASLPARLPAQ